MQAFEAAPRGLPPEPFSVTVRRAGRSLFGCSPPTVGCERGGNYGRLETLYAERHPLKLVHSTGSQSFEQTEPLARQAQVKQRAAALERRPAPVQPTR